MKTIVGENLAFKNLKEYIDSQKDSVPIIIQIAVELGDDNMKKLDNWHDLWRKHCCHYKHEILKWFELEPMIDQPKRIKISEEDLLLLIEILGGMKCKGGLGNYSYAKLARWMHDMFETDKAISTLDGMLVVVESYLYEKLQEEYIKIKHK